MRTVGYIFCIIVPCTVGSQTKSKALYFLTEMLVISFSKAEQVKNGLGLITT